MSRVAWLAFAFVTPVVAQFKADEPFGMRLYAQKQDELLPHAPRRLGEPRVYQLGVVSCVAVSPDGMVLAVQDHQDMTRFYDGADGKLLFERTGLADFLFAPDCQMLATGNLVGTVDLIDLTKGE